jgi:hypothetical protein
MIAINKKSGERYIILQENIINSTNVFSIAYVNNITNNQKMVLYVKEVDAHMDDPQLYVREENEFNEKFERI